MSELSEKCMYLGSADPLQSPLPGSFRPRNESESMALSDFATLSEKLAQFWLQIGLRTFSFS